MSVLVLLISLDYLNQDVFQARRGMIGQLEIDHWACIGRARMVDVGFSTRTGKSRAGNRIDQEV